MAGSGLRAFLYCITEVREITRSVEIERDRRSAARSSHRRNTPAPGHRRDSPEGVRRPNESAYLPDWPPPPRVQRDCRVKTGGNPPAHPRRRPPQTCDDIVAVSGADAAASNAALISPAVVVALSRFFGQTPLHDASQYWRNARWQWCGRFLQNRRRKLHGRRAGEGQCAGRHLVQNDPKRPDVRARIGRFANDDFGRHVTGRAVTTPGWVIPRLRRSLTSFVRGPRVDAIPKSRTFTPPSGMTTTFELLRSRWTMPCSCAWPIASAI